MSKSCDLCTGSRGRLFCLINMALYPLQFYREAPCNVTLHIKWALIVDLTFIRLSPKDPRTCTKLSSEKSSRTTNTPLARPPANPLSVRGHSRSIEAVKSHSLWVVRELRPASEPRRLGSRAVSSLGFSQPLAASLCVSHLPHPSSQARGAASSSLPFGTCLRSRRRLRPLRLWSS